MLVSFAEELALRREVVEKDTDFDRSVWREIWNKYIRYNDFVIKIKN